MMLNLAMLIVGGFFLYFGGEYLVRGASHLARYYGMSAFIIGSTVVAYGTSAPEFVVNIQATMDNHSEVVVGNVLGSCLANLGLILGLIALFRPIVINIHPKKEFVPLLFLVVSIIVIPLFALDTQIDLIDGVISIVLAIIFTVWSLSGNRKPQTTLEETHETTQLTLGVTPFLCIAVGIAMLTVGSRLFLDGAIYLAELLGVSKQTIAFTIIAVGTSLPELITSVIAARRGETGLSIGNLLGSNIFNILFVMGATVLIKPIPFVFEDYLIELSSLFLVTLFTIFIISMHSKISRVEGAILLLFYGLFVSMSFSTDVLP